MKQATTAGGGRLVVAAAKTEEVAEFVLAATEALGRDDALEPAHPSGASFDATGILLKSVILVRAGPVHDPPGVERIARG
jgi:hypothetical protein